MEWKTLATLALGLVAATIGALVPATAPIAYGIAGVCTGAVIPPPKTWGKRPIEDAPRAEG